MFRINQYNVTIVSQSRGKSQLVSELGTAQPQLVYSKILLYYQNEVVCKEQDGKISIILLFDKNLDQDITKILQGSHFKS